VGSTNAVDANIIAGIVIVIISISIPASIPFQTGANQRFRSRETTGMGCIEWLECFAKVLVGALATAGVLVAGFAAFKKVSECDCAWPLVFGSVD